MNTIYDELLKNGNPEAEALTDGKRSLTYRELDCLIDGVRRLMPTDRPGRVAVIMDHGIPQIATLLAVLKSGGTYVAAEPTFPPDRIHDIIDQANVDFIICSPSYAYRFPGRTTILVGDDVRPVQSPTPPVEIPPETPAYILFTSGTTGHPKGVVVSNANVVNYARAFGLEFLTDKEFRMLQHSVCTFDIFVEEVFGTLLNGRTLVICPETAKTDIKQLADFIDRNRVTAVSSFPYLMIEFNKLDRLPRSLSLLISGGDVLRASYVDKLLDKVTVYNTYGPSETTVCASYFHCNGAKPLPDGTYPIGRSVYGVDIKLFEPGTFEPVPDGQPGEICIYGNGVSEGYLKECPESKNFSVDPADGRRLYRSGDLGYRLSDGNLGFLRRIDRQIMIMGKRVECSEVENVLFQTGELESAVVRPLKATDGLAYLIAYIVPKSRERFSLKRLKEKIARRLTSFMIPSYFVALNKIPLTPNGKPDVSRLPVIKMKRSRI